MNRDIRVLSVGQALSSTVISLLTTVSALSGALLAPHPALSTLPVTATVGGTLLMVYPASTLMARLGRRNGFMLKAALGALGGLACLGGLSVSSFVLFTLGAFLLGLFNSFSQYYRFAAIDASPSVDQRAGAVATVTAAGVVGGIAGPYLAANFPAYGLETVYANAFLALLGLCALLAVSQAFLSPALGRTPPKPAPATPHRTLLARPQFLFTSLICAAAFSVMTLTMNAAPLSMRACGIQMDGSSLVLQVHFASMYLPSLFNAALVRRIGAAGLVQMGIGLNAIGCVVAMLADENLGFYLIVLSLSGFGWNFMFNGGTLLLADSYSDAEKARAQGLNSLIVFSSNLVASLGAGALFAYFDWQTINAVCLPVLAACVWMLWRVRKPPQELPQQPAVGT